MKKFTLKVHQSNFSEESLVINAKDFPDVEKEDIVRISSCDTDPVNSLVIKVKSLKDEGDFQKNNISVEQTLALRFNLHPFQSVYVTKVDPVDISLDMVEVMFKDQYVSRSDMWRLKRHLVGSCTCVNEKVEFCDIRAQVNELWITGSKVKCGLVTDSTRIVLRSATALVYIFIQMSREMWDFDAYGQLQFEKAVNGFLKDLFSKWKEKCYHEFTLVLFSRSFFDVSKIEQLPEEVRYAVQKDYRGRFYIDFYYCVAHHERSEDCSPLLFRLKRLFNEYKSLVQISNCPPGNNSSASEGNFLEAINMSLNVFEKHYVDRNFDRTGQLVLCITPGVGVFDVDRDLTFLTKERMIDNGIGSDLVCLGQEPLHAVPLFKFHHKTSGTGRREPSHSFNVPHWINHSFYSPNPFMDKGTVGIKHAPRVNFSLKKQRFVRKKSIQNCVKNDKSQQTNLPPLLPRNVEEYDEEIFGSPQITYRNKISMPVDGKHFSDSRKYVSNRVRTISEDWKQHSNADDMVLSTGTSPLCIPKKLANTRFDTRATSSVGPATNLDRYFAKKEENDSDGLLVGSAHSFHTNFSKKKRGTQRALINPFTISHIMQPTTSNRRRWVHTYPNPQPSYGNRRRQSERISESSDQCDVEEYTSDVDGLFQSISVPVSKTTQSTVGSANSSELSSTGAGFLGHCVKRPIELSRNKEFPWSPTVNWKSLRSPACLPITNDYFPSKLRLNNQYTEQSYNLIPDLDEGQFDGQVSDNLLNIDVGQVSNFQGSQHMTTREVFFELVNQRLCQGFQLVVSCLPKHRTHYDSLTMYSGRRSPPSMRRDTSFTSAEGSSPVYAGPGSISSPDHIESYTLNHGRQYHVVTLIDHEIQVKIHKPRHPFVTSTIEYKYLLWAVGRDRFRLANVKFAHEQYESYHWNYQDNCVCFGGAEQDFKITESIKYWRARFFVIPSPMSKLRYQKAETESARKEGRSPRFDIFSTDKPPAECANTVLDGMLKFIDFFNKVRRASGTSSAQRQTLSRKVAKEHGHQFPGSVPILSQTIHAAQSSTGNREIGKNSLPSDVPSQLQAREGKLDSMKNQCDARQQDSEGSDAESPTNKTLDEESRAKRVARAMLDPKNGFTFLQHQGRLEKNSFVSTEAVHWCLNQDFGLSGIEDAIALFERLREMKYVCHASRDFRHPFLYGYCIFYFVSDEESSTEKHCNRNFESEWLEIEVKLKETVVDEKDVSKTSITKRPRSALSSLLEKDSARYNREMSGLSKMKTVLVPLNNKHKTGRTEWCQVQHPAAVVTWRGYLAFSFNVQWMVATATCLFEMLYSWLREANRCSLCMIPSPNNPFAFPHTEKDASPLHCPLFVPLNLLVLSAEVPAFRELVQDDKLDCRKHIINFMEKIAIRFGFQRYFAAIDREAEHNNTVNSRHFVHYTGQVFLEIPVTRELKVQGRTVATRQQYNTLFHGSTEIHSSPKDVGLSSTRSVSGRRNSFVNLKDCGFYFSVNHMLTKRWRPSACEDCPAVELEADFIEFCSNSDERLELFYKSI